MYKEAWLPSLREFRNLQPITTRKFGNASKITSSVLPNWRRAPKSARPLNILADGDSWFDYPLPPPGTRTSSLNWRS